MDQGTDVKKYDEKGPDRFWIVPDDYHAEWAGVTSDGIQFFATEPFQSGSLANGTGCEYNAVFLWNEDGSFREARIDRLGPRSELEREERDRLFNQRIKELGDYEIKPIFVAPFQVEKFGVTFGLIYEYEVVEGEGYGYVELEPGNFMAFYHPWDGRYDT